MPSQRRDTGGRRDRRLRAGSVPDPDPAPARVLVADDEDDLRSSLRDLLAEEGYTVTEARDGEEALAAATGPTPPDLVLLDVNMPRLDGLDVLRRMRRLKATVGVIVMTAYGTPGIAIQAVQLGAYGYITKPLDSDEVLGAIERWYELRGRARPARRTRQGRVGSTSPEDPIALLGEAVALLLRREAERAEQGGAEDSGEVREMLARLARAVGRSPAGGQV
jgi:DNA-binding NtrC family response regulator